MKTIHVSRCLFASGAIFAGLLSTSLQAASAPKASALPGVSFQYSPANTDLKTATLNSIVICPFEPKLKQIVYQPNDVVDALKSARSDLKVVTPRQLIGLVGKDKADVANGSSIDRQDMLAEIAKATGAEAVLCVIQLGEPSSKSRYQYVRMKSQICFDLVVELYVASTGTIVKQDASVLVEFTMSAFSKAKVTEEQIRRGFATSLTDRILGKSEVIVAAK